MTMACSCRVLLALLVWVLAAAGGIAGEKKGHGDTTARYMVQAGAFRSAANAAAQCAVLQRRGYRTRMSREPEPGTAEGAMFFCRLTGSYGRDAAMNAARRIRAAGLAAARALPIPPPASAALPVPKPPVARAEPPPETEALAALNGRWCGDQVIYGKAPPQIWTMKAGRLTIVAAAPAGDAEITLEGRAELVSAGELRVVFDDASATSQTVYRIEDRLLKGISFERTSKANGMKLAAIPDDLHKCD
jgi:SPOR domain